MPAANIAPTFEPARAGRLPRGASSLPKATVEADQRKRLVVATASVISERGYADATVANIAAVAGISKTTFYELFSDKEACFLYGYQQLSEAHLEQVCQAFNGAIPLPEQLQLALATYLQRINADLNLAHAYIAEAQSATVASRSAFEATQLRLLGMAAHWFAEVRVKYPDVATRDQEELGLMMSGLSGHIVGRLHDRHPFEDGDLRRFVRFAYACLGLYRWAEHLELHGLAFSLVSADKITSPSRQR
jgi:AcrR family transcriptional regulator